MTIALYAGSFDPLTLGHVTLIKRACPYFDRIIVAVMTNTHKHYTLSTNERQAVAQDAVKNFKQVEVISAPEMLTVELAQKVNAQVLLRGVRDSQDLAYEMGIFNMNHHLSSTIDTFFLPALPDQVAVSSSMLKEVIQFGGDVSEFLTPLAYNLLKTKLVQS